MTTNFLLADLRWDEAPGGKAVLHAYPDPLSRGPPWTIGFGSTGSDVGPDTVWTPQQCLDRLTSDVSTITSQCEKAFVWWNDIGSVRQDVFVNMAYQIGFSGLLAFHSTLAAVVRGAWETVAADMRASLWDRQTHARAERLAEQARTGVRAPQPYDAEVSIPLAPQPKGTTFMSLVSTALHFVWDHVFAAAARSAATANPSDAAAGLSAIQAIPAPTSGSPNSPAGIASGPIAMLEDDINNMVANFVKSAVDQLPAVGGVAEVTGLDQKAADAAKALLVLAEQHALTFMSSAFSQVHAAVNSVTVPTSNGAAMPAPSPASGGSSQ